MCPFVFWTNQIPESMLDSDICAHVQEQLCCIMSKLLGGLLWPFLLCCSLEHGTGLSFRFVTRRPKDKDKMEDLQKEADTYHDFLFIDGMRTQSPHRRCKFVYTLYRCMVPVNLHVVNLIWPTFVTCLIGWHFSKQLTTCSMQNSMSKLMMISTCAQVKLVTILYNCCFLDLLYDSYF